MEVFLVYLWLKLDSVIGAFTGVAILIGFATVIALFGTLIHYVEDLDGTSTWKNLAIKLAAAFVLVQAVVVFLPSSKDAAILVGTAIAVEAAKSPEGQKIGTLIRGKANELLDAELKKLQPAK